MTRYGQHSIRSSRSLDAVLGLAVLVCAFTPQKVLSGCLIALLKDFGIEDAAIDTVVAGADYAIAHDLLERSPRFDG